MHPFPLHAENLLKLNCNLVCNVSYFVDLRKMKTKLKSCLHSSFTVECHCCVRKWLMHISVNTFADRQDKTATMKNFYSYSYHQNNDAFYAEHIEQSSNVMYGFLYSLRQYPHKALLFGKYTRQSCRYVKTIITLVHVAFKLALSQTNIRTWQL